MAGEAGTGTYAARHLQVCLLGRLAGRAVISVAGIDSVEVLPLLVWQYNISMIISSYIKPINLFSSHHEGNMYVAQS
jgi:hypothetical protein